MIVVLIVALCIGLVIFFLGLSLLTIYKQDTDKTREDSTQNTNDDRAFEEGATNATMDSYNAGYTKEPKSYIFAVYLGGEGLLLSVIAIIAIFVHQFAFRIRLYVSIPLLVLYLLGCFVVNALKMTRSE